jgi:hypothetical protein
MGIWDSLMGWLRSLVEEPSPPVVPPAEEEPPPSLRPRVLVIVYNPIIHAEGSRTLLEVMGWHDVGDLIRDYVADLRDCSGGFVDYQVVQRMEVDAFPVKADGFRYDEAQFLQCWRSGAGWHEPDFADYEAILAEFDLLNRVESDQIDEVWLFGFPYGGFYESIMVGPEAFWCNAPPIARTEGISRRFVIMGFNYEREVGPMLESFGHRVESILRHTWRQWQGDENLWEQFILYDKVAPGRAGCGNVHFAPNSQRDYEWGNQTRVLSNCDDWLNFPNFQGVVRQVDSTEWGSGDIRAHHKWWLEHLPRAPGHSRAISNNWWWYAVDPNAVQ